MNKSNKNLRQKLLKAIKLNDIEIVKIMLKEKNIDLKFWGNPTEVIIELLNKNCREMSELLMKQGVILDVDFINISKVLILSSINGYTEIVKLLLESKINPNIKDETGNTALIIATENENEEIVKLLLESKGNPNIKGENGYTALISAVGNENEEIIKLLLESGTDLDLKNIYGTTALMLATENGNEEIVKLLLDSKSNPDIQDEKGSTALIIATENGNEEIVKLLLEFESNPNIQDENRNTALIIATENGEDEIVKLLLESKSNPDIQDEKGSTALIIASKNTNEEIVGFVSDSNIEDETKNEWSFLMSASSWGYKGIVKLLLNKGANSNIQDSDGNTALIYSIENKAREMIKILLENGANPNIENNNYVTALMMAYEHGDKEIINFIKKYEDEEKIDVENIKIDGEINEKIPFKTVEEKKLSGKDEVGEFNNSFDNIDKTINRESNLLKNNSKIEIENLNIEKKVFIVDSFFKSYFAKRLDKEEFETFLYDKGYEILNSKNYRNLCHGNRVKKLKTENNFFELRINSGDRIIFTFKEEGIVFLCVDNHNKAIKKGKNIEINNLIKLSAKIEDITGITTRDIIENPIFEYSSLKDIKCTYENNQELYKLTEEQQDIVNQKLPICLYGSAGSGKTTMLLKKIEKILRDNKDAQILFLTHNKKLLRYTKGLYETYSGYKLKQINFKDVNEFFKQELCIVDTGENYFSYENFEEWFDKKSRYNVKLKELSVLEVFSEIKGIIKGFVGFSGKRNIDKENMISREYYTELKNEYSLLKNDETRKLVYSLAIDYEKYLKNNRYYDENDLAIKYLREKTKIPKYDFLACDEVQDLTELQILSMLKAIKDEKNAFLTGDNNQAINLSFFDFGRLETLYRENYDFKDLENSQISINHRSSEKIVELAKKIAEIREETLFANKRISYTEETFIKGGNIPILAPLNRDHLSQLEDKDVTLIVPSVEIKKEIAKTYENTILTTYESKGMERENIICVGLIDYFKDDVSAIVKAIDNSSVEKLSNHYRHFFNLFYVATTRAKKNLVFLDDIDNSIFDSLGESLYKTNNENWLDYFIGIENISDDKLVKYAKEFEEKGLYFEALKNYKKMKKINRKYILRSESFINFEKKKYELALEGFKNLKMWNECLECAVKLKDEESKKKYQIKIYEKEKNYLSLAELYYNNSELQLAFDNFIKCFRKNLPESNESNQIFFDILPNINYKKIERKNRDFIVSTLAKKTNFYKLAVDILVIDKKYKEAEELLELQQDKSIGVEFKLFLLKSDGTSWNKKTDKLKIKGEKNLYKNFYLDYDMSELNKKILRRIDLETLDLFVKNGFLGDTDIIDNKFIEQILNEKKENLINYYLKGNNVKKEHIDVIEKYLEKCIEKSSGKVILKRAKQLLDHPYDFILDFHEKNKIKKLINEQLKSKEISLGILKKSCKGLIEFDSYIKNKKIGEYNSELILNSLDYSSFELEDIMKYQMDYELGEILSRTEKLLPTEVFEKLRKEDQIKYSKYYISYKEEKISNKLTVMNLSHEEKKLKINDKYLKNISSMTKIIIEVEDMVKISLGDEERIVTLEQIVLGEDKVIFK